MQSLLAEIEQRARAVADHPFLDWLGNTEVPVRERLGAWLPNAAFFVFGFRDLNTEVLPYPEAEAQSDPLKQAINRHLAEDATHWPWYLHDLRELGLDRTLPCSETLQFLWGADTEVQRRALYRLCALAGEAAAPPVRYGLIAALEAAAHRLFAALVPVSRQFEAETGRTLLYLGPRHFEREPGHLTNQSVDGDTMFRRLELDPSTRAVGLRIADEVIELIERRWTEFHRVARSPSTTHSRPDLILQVTHRS